MSNTDDIQSIIDIVKSCENAVLATNRLDGHPDVRTIMNALNADITDLHLHFITDADSPKFKQIAHNPKSCIYYFMIHAYPSCYKKMGVRKLFI